MKTFSILIERALADGSGTGDLEDQLIDFFAKNPKPSDEQVHNLADDLGLNPHDLETKIYKLLTDFFASGRWNENGQPGVDPDELRAGIKVEKEHTTNIKIAERIAKDHLAEIKDYYTRLSKMEKKAGLTESAEVELPKSTDDKYIWNIESYTVLGIRQVYLYAAPDRISYDTYKATPDMVLEYINKKYGNSAFKTEEFKFLNAQKTNASTIELVIDTINLTKDVVDYLKDHAVTGYGWKVSVV